MVTVELKAILETVEFKVSKELQDPTENQLSDQKETKEIKDHKDFQDQKEILEALELPVVTVEMVLMVLKELEAVSYTHLTLPTILLV